MMTDTSDATYLFHPTSSAPSGFPRTTDCSDHFTLGQQAAVDPWRSFQAGCAPSLPLAGEPATTGNDTSGINTFGI